MAAWDGACHRFGVLVPQGNDISSLQQSLVPTQCQQLRIKPMAWSCLGGGRLFNDAEFQPLRDELQRVAQEIGAETIEQVVYAWVMRLPSSPLPIIGSGKIERVRSALKAQKLALNRQQWFRIRKAALGYDVP